MSRKDKPFNVVMDKAQSQQLKDLATHLDISQSAVIRNILRYAYQMHFTGKPICASGQQCYAPHMHAPFVPPILLQEKPPCSNQNDTPQP